MREKLSVRKVYRNAYRYVASHLFAFLFLTVFYFLGSLLPIFIGAVQFKVLQFFYTYLFFYFAAGCYYKQQLLWDKAVFLAAGLRFVTAAVLFLCALIFSGVVINFGLYFIRMTFPDYGSAVLGVILDSTVWLVGKYMFIFMLFVSFFIVPSFAFVSEITGKNRSLLTTYAKTKGNFLKIAAVALGAFALMVAAMVVLTYVNVIAAALVRAGVLAFISILYFKMYDYFYNVGGLKKNKAFDEDGHQAADLDNMALKRGKSRKQQMTDLTQTKMAEEANVVEREEHAAQQGNVENSEKKGKRKRALKQVEDVKKTITTEESGTQDKKMEDDALA